MSGHYRLRPRTIRSNSEENSKNSQRLSSASEKSRLTKYLNSDSESETESEYEPDCEEVNELTECINSLERENKNLRRQVSRRNIFIGVTYGLLSIAVGTFFYMNTLVNVEDDLPQIF